MLATMALTTTLALLARPVAAASGTCSDVSYKLTDGMCKNQQFKFKACVPNGETDEQFQAQMKQVASDFAGSGFSVYGVDTCKSLDLHDSCAVVGKTPRTDYCSVGGGFCDMVLANTFAMLACSGKDESCTPQTDISIIHTKLMCCDSNKAVIRSMCGTPAIAMNYTAGVETMKELYACADIDCFSVASGVGEGGSKNITSSSSSAARVLGALVAPAVLAAAVMLA